MKLTPLDIRHQEFAGALSGYSRRAVRAFLADASDAFEELLRHQQTLEERITDLEKRIEEYKAGEDELKRTLVAAERISTEMRSAAQKEVELMIREAEADRERVYGELRARQAELEQHFQSRQAELEHAYRARQTDLEQQYQARATAIEHEAMVRRTELENSLGRLRTERAQFLAQYRALLQGFGELARHHEAELGTEAIALGQGGPSAVLDQHARTTQGTARADTETERDENAPAVPTFEHHL